jgi:cholesterol transport system auxiliary component
VTERRRSQVRQALARNLCLVVLASALNGCSGLFHSNARPAQVYYLKATPIPPGAAPVAASLRFNRPTTSPGLDSAEIVTLQTDRRMSFFLASRWPAPTSYMVEMLAVEKLRRSSLWESVADSNSSWPSDYVLQVVIRNFEADYSSGSVNPEVHVVLDCVIGKREGREVIASFLAEGSAKASANKMSAVVPAFETVANAALDSMANQALDAIRGSLARKTAATD